jgi:acyl-coenzyme A thioesterase PaaI-like protein
MSDSTAPSKPAAGAPVLADLGEECWFEGYSGCIGCSPDHPHGLHLRFFRREDAVRGRVVVPPAWQGADGIAHGGAVTTVLDEYSCAASAFLRGVVVVTGELTVRFEAPCPTGVELQVRAWIDAEERAAYRDIAAEITLGDRVIARSRGRFFPLR